MGIEFDPVKSAKNAAERGLPFTLAEEFDFNKAVTNPDNRRVYPEDRFVATGPLRERICVMVFCFTPVGIRIISLRKANQREIAKHEKATDL